MSDWYREQSWRLSAAKYTNLLPVLRRHLLARRFETEDEYSFIGTPDEYADAQRRCAFLD